MADLKAMSEAEAEEWEARIQNPVTVAVTAFECRDFKWALMLLRRVQGNTRDGDLLRVEEKLSPLLTKIEDTFRSVPEVKEAINKQRVALDLDPLP